ncbi:protein artemis isoform X2 [Anabrus simplex]
MVGLREIEFLNLLSKNSDYFLYCSEISYQILMNTALKDVKENLRILSVHEPCMVHVPASLHFQESQALTLSTIPAGHCPGSVMFLLESPSSTVLYTGDIRIAKGDIQKFTQLQRADGCAKRIDALYLDTTFLDPKYYHFPLRKDSGMELCRLIQEWTDQSHRHHVQLVMPAKYGYEFLYVEIFKKLGIKVHVTDEIFKLYQNVAEVESSLTANPEKAKVHACQQKGFFGFRDYLSCLRTEHKLRCIKCSAMWYQKSDKEAVQELSRSKDHFHQIVYSSHSSFSELVDIVKYLQPKKVVPCVVPDRSSEYKVSRILETILGERSPKCKKKPLDHQAGSSRVLEFKYLKRKSREWGRDADARAAIIKKAYEDLPSPPRPKVEYGD